jgi:hypothetical protein
VLSGVTYLYNRTVKHRQIGFEDVSTLDEHRPEGPLPRR